MKMVLQKRLERRCLMLCRRSGVPVAAVVARCEREVAKRRKKRRNFPLRWKSFFVGSRVVVTVTPFKRFRHKDKDLHHHFNWATILWHKFNGLDLQINEYLTMKEEKAAARKQARRRRKPTRRDAPVAAPAEAPRNDAPLVVNEDSSDEVQLIEEHSVINLDSDEEKEEEDLSFIKIVSVASAGTIIDKVANVVTMAEKPVPVFDEMDIRDEWKPTNEELERAREIFSSMDCEAGQDNGKEEIHSALYSLDDSFSETDGRRSANQGGDRTFLDSLADKLGVERSDQARQLRTERSFEDCYNELEQTFRKVNQAASRLDPVVVKDEDTSSSTEFYGFNEDDSLTPGLLPTPVVRQAGSNSAFISEKCDKLMEKLGPINVDRAEIVPRRKVDEGRINRHSEPPMLECPELPSDLKSRTLAEKRQLLRLKPVGYQVMDQENSVYHLLKKRMKEPASDKLFDHARRIMRQPVPMRRNVWKTATWLNTRQDHYIYRYILHEGKEVKLFGCVGNFRQKDVKNLDFKPPPRNFTPHRKMLCCRTSGFPKRLKFNNILNTVLDEEKKPECVLTTEIKKEPEKEESVETVDAQMLSPVKRKWIFMESRKIPPGPLCTKPKNAEISENLAPLETYVLPRIYLQVSPQINQPFPFKVKRYLMEMCPYEKLTDKWVNFSLSTLKDAKEGEMTEFEIPYENNRRKILVSREVYASGRRRDRTTEVFDDSEPLTFNVDLPEDDEGAQECAKVLEDMINSVAIGRCEDDFSKWDPDLNYAKKESRKRSLEPEKDGPRTFKKPRTKSSLLSELKRLNATIINTESINRQQKCNQHQCKMGCICDSISTLSYPIGHCEKIQCMFECVCEKGLVVNNFNVNPFSKEVFRIRDKAISRLARAEKDFSSTVVLTNNNTFLLSNSSEEKSKRNRTVPRKFGDYVSSEVDEEEITVDVNDASVKYPHLKAGVGKRGAKPVKFDPDLEKMRHTSVVLTRIGKIVDAMEPWCMIHELYRCFCNCEARYGKPFMLTQISDNCIALSEELVAKPGIYRASTRKAKVLLELQSKAPKVRDIAFVNTTFKDALTDAKAILEPTQSVDDLVSCITETPDPEEQMIDEYIRSLTKASKKVYKRGELTKYIIRGSVSRCIAFDSSTQLQHNRKNAPRVKKFIAAMEKSKKILNLLRRRYLESACKSKRVNLNIPAMPQMIESESEKSDSQPPMQLFDSECEETRMSEIVHSLEMSESVTDDAQVPWKDDENLRNAAQPGVPIISSVTSLSSSVDKETENSSQGLPDLPFVNMEDVRNSLLDKLNLMVSKMMSTISKNEEKLSLDTPIVNKITTIKWLNLLREYRSYRLHIWEVHYPQKSYLVITRLQRLPVMPPGYTEIVDLRAAKKTVQTQFACMINLSYNLPLIENIAALLFGHSDYWQVMGFMKKTVEGVDPTSKYLSVSKDTHPEVAGKISHLYDILLQKVRASGSIPTISNVKLMSKDEVKNAKLLKFPLPSQLGQRWFMLMITNDFSDISHPKWGQLLSFDRIRFAIMMAEKNGRTVQVKSNNSMCLNPSVYVAPNQTDRIFIGPYDLDEECNIVLYQRLDGSILLRETYEKMTNVHRTTSTMGCWIQLKSGTQGTVVVPSSPSTNPMMTEVTDSECDGDKDKFLIDPETGNLTCIKDDDEDCVLVEADPKEIKAAVEAHEAEEAVNSILPDGQKLPTLQPKTHIGNQDASRDSSDTPPEPGRIRVIPADVLTSKSGVEDSSVDKPKKRPRKRKAAKVDDQPKLNIKDLTIIPMNDNEYMSGWDRMATESPKPALTILPIEEKTPPHSFPVITKVTSGQRDSPERESTNLPVISKVMSLGEVEKDNLYKAKSQQSLLKSNVVKENSENDSKESSSEAVGLTPYEQQFAQYIETKAINEHDMRFQDKKIFLNRRKTVSYSTEYESPGKGSMGNPKTSSEGILSNVERSPSPKKLSVLKSQSAKTYHSPGSVQTESPQPVVVRATVVGKSSEPVNVTSQQTSGMKVAFTTSGKKVIIHPVPVKNITPGVIDSSSINTDVAQKRSSPPPLTFTKRFKATEAESSQSPPAETSTLPVKIVPPVSTNVTNRVTIGQTVLQKLSMLPAVSATSGSNVLKTMSVVTSSTSPGAKSMPSVISCNGLGSQMMKVMINFNSASAGSLKGNAVILPNTAAKIPAKPVIIQVPKSTAGPSTSTSSGEKSPVVLTLPDGNKTLTFTRTTPDGKSMKYVLPVSKIPKSSIKFIPAASVSQVPTSDAAPVKVLTLVQTPSTSDQSDSTSGQSLASGSKKGGGDVIELSDDEAIVEDPPQSKPSTEECKSKEKLVNGWIVSNIPQLGYIRTRMSDNTYYYIQLPTRRHPFKVGCNCLDRYMDRYMKYCVAMFLPQDLSVRWEFVQDESLIQAPGEKFSLEATRDKHRLILTSYGVLDMQENIPEDLGIESTTIMQLLIARLAYATSGVVKPFKGMRGIEIVEEATRLLGEWEEASFGQKRTIQTLTKRRNELRLHLEALCEGVTLPTVEGAGSE